MSVQGFLKSSALSASAGSGKTYALTTRLILMLLEGRSPSEICAITFTKMASSEIREKLFIRLEKMKMGDESEVSFFCELSGWGKKEVVQKAVTAEKKLIRYFSLLQISTIHGFFAKIIKSFPEETGYAVNLSVLDEFDQKTFKREAIEQFYNYLTEDEKFFERVYSFILSYRDSKLITRSAIEEVYREVESGYYFLHKLIPELERDDFSIEEFHRARNFLSSQRFIDRVEKLIDILSEYIQKMGNSQYLIKFLYALGDYIKYKNIKKLCQLPPILRDPVRNPLLYIQKLLKNLPEDKAKKFMNNLLFIRSSLSRYLEAEMRFYLSTWMKIYGKINDFYTKMKEHSTTLDFIDIELLSKELLNRLSDYQLFDYRTDLRIRHLLIDEFQDTSSLQWEAILNLVKNCLAEGGSIFYVGDVKQSIYRWRGGDPSLFKNVKKSLYLEEESLYFSYRQNRVLLDFINQIFGYISENVCPEFSYQKQELPPEKKNEVRGYVNVKRCKDQDELQNELVSRIDFLNKNGVNLSDIAVLCRKNVQVEKIENLFLENRIPFVSTGRSKLFKNYCMLDMMNLLSLILNPWDKLYLTGVLRSPIFRFSYEKLVSMEKQGEISFETLKKIDLKVYKMLISIIKIAQYLPTSQILIHLFRELNLLWIYPDKKELLTELYGLACDFEYRNKNLYLLDFVNYLRENSEEISLPGTEGKGVTIQTIHSSKGLEYQTVILPYLDQSLKLKMDGSLIYRKDFSRGGTSCAIGRNLYRSYLSNRPEMEGLFERASLEYEIDEINVLYVALTRAKENLVILPYAKSNTVGELVLKSVGFSSKDNDGFSFEKGIVVKSQGLPGFKGKRYEVITLKEEALYSKTLENKVEFKKEVKEKLNILGGEKEDVFEKPGYSEDGESLIFEDYTDPYVTEDTRKKRIGTLKGLLFHHCIEEFCDFPLQALALEGKKYTENERKVALEAVRESLGVTLKDRRIEKFFKNGSFKEVVSISTFYRNYIGRIDRMIIGERIEIIDFKTNAVQNGGHLKVLIRYYSGQVLSYCRALAIQFPEKEIHGYLYFTDAPYESRFVEVSLNSLSYCRALAIQFPEKEIHGYLYFTDAPYESRFVEVSLNSL